MGLSMSGKQLREEIEFVNRAMAGCCEQADEAAMMQCPQCRFRIQGRGMGGGMGDGPCRDITCPRCQAMMAAVDGVDSQESTNPRGSVVMEKEGEMRPFLEKAKELLVQATIEIRKSMKAGTDNTVSPGEIKLMHQVEAQIEALAKLVKDGLENE